MLIAIYLRYFIDISFSLLHWHLQLFSDICQRDAIWQIRHYAIIDIDYAITFDAIMISWYFAIDISCVLLLIIDYYSER